MKDWIYPNLNRQTSFASPLFYRQEQAPDSNEPVYTRSEYGIYLPFPAYQSCADYEKDKRYLTSLYPEYLLPILESIRIHLEETDAGNSFLQDRYPDKESLLRLVYEIYDALAAEIPSSPNGDSDPVGDGDEPLLPPLALSFTTDPRNPWLLGLIQVLLSGELLARRRCRR